MHLRSFYRSLESKCITVVHIRSILRPQRISSSHLVLPASTASSSSSAAAIPFTLMSRLNSSKAKSSPSTAVASSSSSTSSSSSSSSSSSCITTNKHSELLLHIEVKPGVKENSLELQPTHLHVRLSASPIEGEANRALIALLADELHLRKSALSIVTGATSRTKTMKIDAAGDSGGSVKALTPDIILTRINAAIAAQNG